MSHFIKFNLFLCLFTAWFILCTCKNKEVPIVEPAGVKSFVSIVHPSFQNISEYVQLNGVTLFLKKNKIRSNITGYITSLKFKQGDYIKAGQLFCNISTKEQEALKKITSLDSSLAKFQKPQSVLANASGVITAINNLEGDYVSEGDVLANFSEPSSLIVQLNVPYEYNRFVGVGKLCEIILPDGNRIQTPISGVMPTVEATSQSQSFFIRLPNRSIPENLNVIVRIAQKQRSKVLSVPSASIQTDELQKEFWLMKIMNDSIAVKIPIKIGLQNDSLTEIISDKIRLEDLIILQGAYGLADSTFVSFDKK